MNDITDQSIMTALGRQLTVAVARQSVSAGNLANVDTPGYRTREVSFDEVLESQVGAADELATTHPGHLTAPTSTGATRQSHEVDGLPTRRDGNTVELDRELLKMSQASADFSAAQTALTAKFRMVRYAIQESR